VGAVLLLCSYNLRGQHGGHGGGGGRGGAPPGTAGTSDSSLQDFNHALAVQATPDQTSQFQALARSTETARKQAQELLQLVAKASDSADFSYQTTALKDAVEDAQGGNQYFVNSFSKSQKAGLKQLMKKLERADSAVARQKKTLDQQLGHSRGDREGIASIADKLAKALSEFQEQQLSLGKEMGIQVARNMKGQARPCGCGQVARIHTALAKSYSLAQRCRASLPVLPFFGSDFFHVVDVRAGLRQDVVQIVADTDKGEALLQELTNASCPE